MKRITLFLTVMLFSLAIFAQKNEVKIKLKADENSFEVVSKSTQNLTVKSTLSALYVSESNTKGGDFSLLQANGLIKVFDVGNPNIPVISKLIEVPQDAKVKINIVSYDEQIINLADHGIVNKIIPAQRSIFKNEDPIDVPFAYNKDVYKKDGFVNTTIATYEESGMLRATRIGRLEISPIQYNPAKNEIRVLNNLVVEIEFVGANLSKTQALKTKYASPYFNNIYDGQLLNYTKVDSKELVQATTHLVIVSDRMFEAQLAEFIAWKEFKGFDVTVGYTDVIGTTNATIKAYLQDIYEGSDPMEFVLFVGDIQQVPEWTDNEHTDLRYCEYTGDNIPEVYYGRFSAQTTEQLQPQIDKTLLYEKYEMSDPSYLSEVFLVAGDDSGFEMVHGNGAIWYADNYYMTAENGVNAHTYLQPLDNAEVSNIIFEDMNAGLAFANYTAHCSSAGWATPSFSTSDVKNLTNDGKYGLWIGNCCQSVEFFQDECFGEAALRQANGGAIGDIGGSNSTQWDEDYWWGVGMGSPVAEPAYENFGLGAYDGVMHTQANETSTSTWYSAQGQINVCGNLAVEASTSESKQYYWEIYHLMGDPTLMNYIGVPNTIAYELAPAVLMIGSSSTEISTVPYGYIAVHQGGNRICVAMADESGDATLDFSSPIVGGDVTLVITAQNKQPLITTITPLALNEPYVVISSYTPDNLNYNSNANINAVFENLAADYDASNVVATLTTSDSYITIIDGTENIGAITGAGTINITDAFEISFANNVPDQYEAELTVTITGSPDYEWISTINVTANAPAFAITEMTLSNDDNGNGRLDPGESADLTFTTSNTGHANATDVLASLIDNSDELTINTDEQSVTINTDGTTDVVFNVTASSSTVEGTLVNLTMNLNKDDIYTNSFDSELIIGQAPIVVIGEGTETASDYPFNTYYNNNKTQMLYLGSEIGSKGIVNIDKIAFDYSELGSPNQITNLSVKFLETNSTELGTSYEGMTDATEVLSAPTFDMPSATGWFEFDTDNFEFNTSNNLIVEITWGPVDYSSTYKLNCTSSDFTSVAYGYDDDEIPPTYDSNTKVRPNTTLMLTPPAVNVVENIEAKFNIYPNPSTGIFNIDLPDNKEVINISVIDITGKVILNKSVKENSTSIDLSGNSQGVYIIKFQLDEETINQKIIVE